MSWRTGAELFWAIWKLAKEKIPEEDIRADFAKVVVNWFLEWDVDPMDLEDIDDEIDRILDEINPPCE